LKAKIFSHIHLIGTTNLQVGDESMGCVFGEFIPTDFYFEKIQASVWEFWQTNKPDYKKWHALRLNVQLENGLFLFPMGGYTIDDINELPHEPKRIDLAGLNWKILQDFIKTNPPRPFVDEPWKALTIEQKIAFEDELKKELGSQKSVFSFFRKHEGHILSNSEFSAFCYDIRNDNVLFEVYKPGLDKHFALVHLTWKGKKEKNAFPITTFYSDFDEFKFLKMGEDKADWED
jgi:hypothetical protein